jgi:hypothetical protein
LRLSPSFAHAAGFLESAYARSGDPDRAERLMADVRARSTRHHVSATCFGTYHAVLGNTDSMFECLQVALAERDPYLTRMDAEPCFAAYRSDPRYRELPGRMNLGHPPVR